MDKEEQIIVNRMKELANTAYQRGIPMYSDFLNMNQQNIIQNEYSKMPPASLEAAGGYHLAERKVLCFYPKAWEYGIEPPIRSLLINPLNGKFAEELTHRDFLGAVLNLGIERSKIGDIVKSDQGAYLFCIDKMAGYVIDNLTRIKHTPVMVNEAPFEENGAIQYEEISGSITSVRLDSILALCFHSSRSGIIKNIEEGKVFVNAKLITTNSYNLKEDDIISVRGLGKFRYAGTSAITKKGRYIATVYKYQ